MCVACLDALLVRLEGARVSCVGKANKAAQSTRRNVAAARGAQEEEEKQGGGGGEGKQGGGARRRRQPVAQASKEEEEEDGGEGTSLFVCVKGCYGGHYSRNVVVEETASTHNKSLFLWI